MLHQPSTLNCKGRLLEVRDPIVMGILNVTPDSFYDGGNFFNEKDILSHTEKMLEEGAAIIDIGGMSSRPGAKVIEVDEELDRVIPAIKAIHTRFPEAILSIDTVRAKVAEEAIGHGAHIINDISAGSLDDQLFATVGRLGVPYILMHMKGRPENMQKEVEYDDIIVEVTDFLIEKVGQLRALNVKDIIIDPGFGFGKSIKHNFQLLKQMHAFGILECIILAGISRKSFIYKTLKTNPEKVIIGTTALHMIALEQGAKILRAHDVGPAIETIELWKAMQEA